MLTKESDEVKMAEFQMYCARYLKALFPADFTLLWGILGYNRPTLGSHVTCLAASINCNNLCLCGLTCESVCVHGRRINVLL